MKKKGKAINSILTTDENIGIVHAHVSPLYLSSTYIYESPEHASAVFSGKGNGFIYGRWSHPNAELVEEKLAILETDGSAKDAIALLFSSGMSALSSLFVSLLKPGDKILAQGNIYGTSVDLFNYYAESKSVEVIYADFSDLRDIDNKIKKDSAIKVVYVETPSNPTLCCYDLKKIAEIVKDNNRLSIVDNTFATAVLQKPLILGFDFVVYSATKYLNGHGTGLSGAVVGSNKNFMQKELWKVRKLHGSICSPMDAWLLNLGLKTLSLRIHKHCNNAIKVAKFLESHPAVGKVYYPGLKSHESHKIASKQMMGFGGVVAFELKKGYKAGVSLMKKVKLCRLTASLGTCDSLIQHPASMSHSFVPKAQRELFGITAGLIRLSVGIEEVEDVISDLKQALS